MGRAEDRSRLMRQVRGVGVRQDFAVDPGRGIAASPETVPILINSFNRLSYLRELVESLRSRGYENLYVIDNASTYEPLLRYYDEAHLRVFRLDANVGYLAMWTTPVCDLFIHDYYVYTDCDVVPAPECPPDFIARFQGALVRYPDIAKIGFGLKTDDLPDGYAMKESVVEHERQFLAHPAEPGLYRAPIDTTFALYRPGAAGGSWLTALRTGEPYLARHLPWYADSADPTDEEIIYQETTRTSTHWTLIDPHADAGVRKVMVWGRPLRVVAGSNDDLWTAVSRGERDAQTYEVLDRLLDEAHSFVDIGAGVGQATLYACGIARAVVATETDPDRSAELERNLTLNPGCADKVTLLDDHPVNLAGFMSAQGIDDCAVVRMDMGGDEYRRLSGMLPYLRQRRPALVLVLHPRRLSRARFRSRLARAATAAVACASALRVIWSLRFYKHFCDDQGRPVTLDWLLARDADEPVLIASDKVLTPPSG